MSAQPSQDEDRAATFVVLDELHAAFEAAVPTPGRFFEITTTVFTALARLWRCFRLFQAIVILLRANLPEEAAIVARSLFVESLWLREMGDDVDQRMGFAARFWADALTEKRDLFQKLTRDSPDSASQLERFKDEERQLAAFQGRHQIKHIPRFLSTRAAALRYRQEDYWFFEVSHQYVHGSDLSMVHQVQKVGDRPDHLGIYGRTNDLRFIVLIATFSSLSLVQAAQGAFQVSGWQGAERLAEIQDRLEPIIRRTEAAPKS